MGTACASSEQPGYLCAGFGKPPSGLRAADAPPARIRAGAGAAREGTLLSLVLMGTVGDACTESLRSEICRGFAERLSADMERLGARRRGRRTGCREGRSQAAACLPERERAVMSPAPLAPIGRIHLLCGCQAGRRGSGTAPEPPGGGRCAGGSGSVAHGCGGASAFQSQGTQRCEQNVE